jgi:beta-glucosidase-like glycosyl hydrolase
MQNYYQFIIPRLNGIEIKKKFRYYLSLAKKGVAGFIVFGGELNTLRIYLAELQNASGLPLIISSDLERGLGQQVRGGTLFPPAMAMASAVKGGSPLSDIRNSDLNLFRNACRAVAREARFTGINTIFAPVLDVNTNPGNPIISVRAFGEDPDTVSFFGSEMIREMQACGVAACGKHFPGHGDTEVDSHIRLPVIKKSLRMLQRSELRPFERAIGGQLRMIMLGHLSVPALDSSGLPVSISRKAVRFLRSKMNFSGIIITDAMNMGGLGAFSEEEASFMSLDAGADIILHPTDPDRVVSYLEKKKKVFDADRLTRFRTSIGIPRTEKVPDFKRHCRASDLLTEKAVKVTADFLTREKIFLVILNDDQKKKGTALARALRRRGSLTARTIMKGDDARKILIPEGCFVITALFSETKGWKGGASAWLLKQTEYLRDRTGLFVSFGSPYLIRDIRGKSLQAKILAYCDSESAQKTVAKVIGDRAGFPADIR